MRDTENRGHRILSAVTDSENKDIPDGFSAFSKEIVADPCISHSRNIEEVFPLEVKRSSSWG